MITLLQGGALGNLMCAAPGYYDALAAHLQENFRNGTRNGTLDCGCMLETMKSHPDLKQSCTCTACPPKGGSCTCDLWDPVKFGAIAENPAKYDYLRCHIRASIDYENQTMAKITE